MLRRRQIIKLIKDLFTTLKIDFKMPPHTEEGGAFEAAITEIYSTKDAARKAGLGWIGKSNLFVTKRFGPRVTMAEFLVNDPLEADAPIEESFCGSCEQCYKNCAFQALYNKTWYPGIHREEQVDYVKCSHSRLSGYEKIGRKIACGKCVAACPYGTGKNASFSEKIT
jgi:epoxyqueuosine reductase QueG